MKSKTATLTATTPAKQITWKDEITRLIDFVERRMTSERDAFYAEIDKVGILSAIEWYGERVARTDAEYQVLAPLGKYLKETKDDNAAQLKAALEWTISKRREILTGFRLATSTSPFSNAVENAGREMKVKMLDQMGGSLSSIEHIITDEISKQEAK